jgi:hypothetical protein
VEQPARLPINIAISAAVATMYTFNISPKSVIAHVVAARIRAWARLGANVA